jgi:2-polyprenyl-3-methyl-5-hydroxy-6-metoxy-1,4-benzoquinol methylase
MKTKSVKKERWEKAQQYEKSFWENQAQQTIKTGPDRYRWYEERAKLVYDRTKDYLKDFKSVVALEIGSGPVGLINYIHADERYALDPLEEFNKNSPGIQKVRDPHVRYFAGMGENVSSLNQTFNFVILDNVLDHCQNPQKVLVEIYKNLGAGGILFFSINIYTNLGVIVRNFMEIFEIDKGHPFNFTEKGIRLMIQNAGFEFIELKMADYETQKNHYRNSNSLKNKLKSYLGLTDIRFSAICRKSE